MKINTITRLSTLIILFSFTVLFAQFPSTEFEIVESYPLETDLDNADIRNTNKVWLELINNAQYTIDLEHFYISNRSNSALDTICQALKKAIKRGVKVRLLLDKRMSSNYPEGIAQLSQFGVKVRTTTFFNSKGGVQHAKFMIIDTNIVFIGSQNFDWRALEHIHEIGLKIVNRDCALQLLRIFDYDWKNYNKQNPSPIPSPQTAKTFQMQLSPNESIQFYLTASPRNFIPELFRWDETALLELINSAEKSIVIQLLSYSTNSKNGYYTVLDKALRKAAGRGVKVSLLISDWATASQELSSLKSLAKVKNVTVKLLTIPEYSGGYIPYARVIHSKYCLVDDEKTWIGTSNWGKSYFYTSRNIGLVITSPTINQRFKKIFLHNWDSPYAWILQPDKDYQPKFYR